MTESIVVLVTGSQGWKDYPTILEALSVYHGRGKVTVRHGDCATGADQLADVAARELGFEVDPCPADWSLCAPSCNPGHRKMNRRGQSYCPAAGYIRNTAMVNKDPKPDVCLAFGMLCTRDGGKCTVVPGRHVSHGTRHCSYVAKEAGIEVLRFKAGFDA